jgi:hypothetical protein
MAQKKPQTKSPAKPAKVVKAATKAAKPAKAAKRTSWLDKRAHPVIEEYARQLESFVAAMADGVIDDSEIKAQEARLVGLMKEIEPELNDDLHEKITRLLCELTAYDLMHMMHAMNAARPKTVFRG